MTTFAEVMQSNPPRLVVQFGRDSNGQEQYGWGIVGNIPPLTLIGAICGIQAMLIDVADELYRECPESALVLVYNPQDKLRPFDWFVHPDIPRESLVGMLEIVKEQLVGAQLAKMMASMQRSGIVGPDGQPVRR